MDTEEQHALITELLQHFKGGMAFVPLTEFLPKMPYDKLGLRPASLPYSFYEIFYHIKFAQEDILCFIAGDTYRLPHWPDDYWPEKQAPSNKTAWQNLQADYRKDYKRLKTLLEDEDLQLLKPVKNASKNKQTLVRELLLLIEHQAYHTGQLLLIMRLLKVYD